MIKEEGATSVATREKPGASTGFEAIAVVAVAATTAIGGASLAETTEGGVISVIFLDIEGASAGFFKSGGETTG